MLKYTAGYDLPAVRFRPPASTPVPNPTPVMPSSAKPALASAGGNPLLWKEIRAALRNVRAFALLAIYVAILGAIVVSQFPSETNVSLQDGGTRGRDLFSLFIWAQALMVVILLPSLSVGALAQERERQTLQPLLMTPLTPLQIVWGKAGGSLALAFILLLGTLPLTSLCFLLGGISPGELLAAYAALLGLSLFCIGVGLYCAAHWRNTTQATLISYLVLPPALGVMALFAMPGIVLAGIVVLAWGVWGLSLIWRRWEKGRLAKTLRLAWWPLFWLLAVGFVCLVLWAMVASRDFGPAAFAAAFVVPYMVFAAQIALQQAAREIVLNQDPAAPLKARLQDFKEDWQAAVVTQPLPSQTYLPTSATTYAPAPAQRKPPKPTYGIEPFLPDNLNPVFAREMRAGLAGKAEYFFRFGYIATIVTEVGMLAWMGLQMSSDSYASDTQVLQLFAGWAILHLSLLMLAAAWLGARAFAPEREGQTLPQLLTVPMPASQVAWGKFAAVVAQSGYVFLMGAPLALLLSVFGFLSWIMAGRFFILELACGGFAAAWGLWCSMRYDAVRRALGLALGGVAFLLVLGPLFGGILLQSFNAQTGGGADASLMGQMLWPASAIGGALATPNATGINAGQGDPIWLLTAAIYAGIAVLLFALTAVAFRRYAKTA